MNEEEKARRREYNSKPEVKARRKERDNRPEAKERRRELDRKRYPEIRDKMLAQKKEHYYKTKPRATLKQRDWRPIIQRVKEELAKYEKLGIKPTLRTMHYRLFSLGIINNTKADYGRLSRNTTKAREYDIRGIEKEKRYFETLPIDCFADDTRQATRYISEFSKWQPEKHILELLNQLEDVPIDYETRIPRWLNQPHYVEIWIEKRAMKSTFEQLVKGREVDIVPFGGFHSVPYLYDNAYLLKAYQGLERYIGQDGIMEPKKIHILYFGDFDPTGEVIEKVLRERLDDYGVYDIDFQRIGVTYDQMIKLDLPQKLDPKTYKKIKDKDSNAGRFIQKYGKLYQVEVDALPAKKPEEFKKMIIDNIDKYFDQGIYDKVLEQYSTQSVTDLVAEMVRDRFGLD
jgi:hypothetical protein